MDHFISASAFFFAVLVSSLGHAQQCGVIVSHQNDFVNTVSAVFRDLTCPSFESRLNALQTNVESRLNTIETAISSVQQQLTAIAEQLVPYDGPPQSCADVLARNSHAQSGMYEIADAEGHLRNVYCDMTTECGGLRGWTRIAFFNMSDPSQESCPPGFLWETPRGTNLRLCFGANQNPGCSSMTFPSGGIVYDKVCGRVHVSHGTNQGGLDDFRERYGPGPWDIDSYYVDGVSITHGSPRHHIWTLAPTIHCECVEPPAFVGDSYFCRFSDRRPDQTLFAGEPCVRRHYSHNCDDSICNANSPEWFYKEQLGPTSDDIEVRACKNRHRGFKEVYIKLAEILIR